LPILQPIRSHGEPWYEQNIINSVKERDKQKPVADFAWYEGSLDYLVVLDAIGTSHRRVFSISALI